MTNPEPKSNPARERVTGLSWDALLAAAARRLVKLDKVDTALALTEATIVRMVGGRQWTLLDLELEVSGDYFDVLADPAVYLQRYDENDFGEPYPIQGSALLASVFTAVLPTGVQCDTVEVKVRVDPVTDDWREQVRASLESGPSNQGRPFGTSKVLTHAGLNYRTTAEVAIAKVLEQAENIKRRQPPARLQFAIAPPSSSPWRGFSATRHDLISASDKAAASGSPDSNGAALGRNSSIVVGPNSTSAGTLYSQARINRYAVVHDSRDPAAFVSVAANRGPRPVVRTRSGLVVCGNAPATPA